MSRIVVVGGHGRVALLATPLLVANGHEVTSLVRDPRQQDAVRAAGATPVVADVERLDVAALTDLLRGHDVVVWSAGAGGGDPARTYAVDRDAAIRSVDAALAAGVRRYVMVSYFGAGPEHGVPPEDPFHPYAEAKAAADAHLMASDLDWTVLQPSTLSDAEPTGRIDLDGTATARDEVPRGDVARVVAAVVDLPSTVRTVLPFAGGDEPIEQALP